MRVPQDAERAVATALKLGFSGVDTANHYMNQEAVARGIARSGVSRARCCKMAAEKSTSKTGDVGRSPRCVRMCNAAWLWRTLAARNAPAGKGPTAFRWSQTGTVSDRS